MMICKCGVGQTADRCWRKRSCSFHVHDFEIARTLGTSCKSSLLFLESRWPDSRVSEACRPCVVFECWSETWKPCARLRSVPGTRLRRVNTHTNRCLGFGRRGHDVDDIANTSLCSCTPNSCSCSCSCSCTCTSRSLVRPREIQHRPHRHEARAGSR